MVGTLNLTSAQAFGSSVSLGLFSPDKIQVLVVLSYFIAELGYFNDMFIILYCLLCLKIG